MSAQGGPLSLGAARSTAPEVGLARVERFIAEWISPELGPSTRCSHFCLVHVSGDDGGREPITTVEVPKKLPDDKKPERVAEAAKTLVDAALSAVQSSVDGRVAKFAVCAYKSAAIEAVPFGQVFFNLETPAGMGVGMGESEDATPAGALGQSMRWSENFARMLVSATDRAGERADKLLDKCMDRLERLEDVNMRLVEQREKLLDGAAQRSLSMYKDRLGIEREERLMRIIEFYGTQWVGKKLGLATGHPLVAFLQGVDTQTLQKMAAQLPLDKQGELAQILQQVSAASGQAAAAPPRMVEARVVAEAQQGPPAPAKPANGSS